VEDGTSETFRNGTGSKMSDLEMKNLRKLAQDRGVPFKVLIVDDEKWVRETFKDFCQITDALEVEMALSASEAMDKIKNCKLDIATIDLIVPDMSGLDLLSEIKKVSPSLPVMIVTGNATDKLVHKAGIMGASRILHKPVDLITFVSEIASTLIERC